MTWTLPAWGRTRRPVTGVPWRDLSDEEFAAAEALFGEGVLRSRAYFEREKPAVVSRTRRRTRKATTTDSAEPETPAEEG
jgi:hypothetical protein